MLFGIGNLGEIRQADVVVQGDAHAAGHHSCGLHLLVDDAVEAEVIDAPTSERFGDLHAEEACGARRLEHRKIDFSGGFPLISVGYHFLLHEGANAVAKHLVLIVVDRAAKHEPDGSAGSPRDPFRGPTIQGAMPDAQARTAVVISGGDPLTPTEISAVPDGAFIVAADSGVDRAIEAGVRVHVAVGDFDSITATGYVQIENEGVEIERHPASKDETDLELALTRALVAEPDRLVVLGLDGGRFDHHLASVLLLIDSRLESVEVEGYVGATKVSVIRDKRTLTGRVGDIVTLLPVGGPAEGITTSGLKYPLSDATLAVGSPRGVSNVLTAAIAVVAVEQGVLLGIQPS